MNRPDVPDEDPDVKSPVTLPSARSEAPVEDSTLVGRIRGGDAGAFEANYHRYGTPCYSLARRILGDEQLAQDVVQEVFLALWKDARRYDRSRGGFATWLLSMTHHKAVDVVRREENLRKRHTAAQTDGSFAPPVAQPDDQVDSPLWSRPDVLLSPHTAGLPLRENERIVELFAENLQRHLRGEELLSQIRSG